jgi:hypothetical protein
MRGARRARQILVGFLGWFKDSGRGIDFQFGPYSRFEPCGGLRARRLGRSGGCGFFDGQSGGVITAIVGWIRTSGYALTDLKGDIVVERTGVRLLVGDAQFRQKIENDVGLDLELAG